MLALNHFGSGEKQGAKPVSQQSQPRVSRKEVLDLAFCCLFENSRFKSKSFPEEKKLISKYSMKKGGRAVCPTKMNQSPGPTSVLSQTVLSRLCYKSVVMFLSPSAIINSSALAASNISKHRENNSSVFRKGGSPVGS